MAAILLALRALGLGLQALARAAAAFFSDFTEPPSLAIRRQCSARSMFFKSLRYSGKLCGKDALHLFCD